MTWVKVCGLTRAGDVAAAVTAGADAVGFVLDPASPRHVTVERAADLARGVPILRVLVTVDAPAIDVLAAIDATGADGVQPHGANGPDVVRAALERELFVLFPVGVGGSMIDVGAIDQRVVPLLDTAAPGRHGGTGRTFDWSRARDIGRDVVIAGGLGPDNVATAVRAGRPWGVDASSRLEVEAGVKDHGKVAAFVQEAKQA